MSLSEVSCAEKIMRGQIAVKDFDPLTHTYECEFCRAVAHRTPQ